MLHPFIVGVDGASIFTASFSVKLCKGSISVVVASVIVVVASVVAVAVADATATTG